MKKLCLHGVQTASTFEELANRLNGVKTTATIGVFDGVHLGHQALLDETVEWAEKSATTPVAISFAVHPLTVLAPAYAPRTLITPSRKRQLLRAAGVAEVLMLEFTPTLAATPPEAFIRDYLVKKAGVRNLVCGYDFTFGSRGSGNVEMLQSEGPAAGFEVRCLGPILLEGQPVKSTHIRDLLNGGRVDLAAEFLGRPHELPGIVVRGHQRGRTIGFPTANLQFPVHYQVPAGGVYVCAARIGVQPDIYPAMVNIGTNPTFGDGKLSVEAYLLNFNEQIVGEQLTLYFLRRLRDEQKFSGVDALVMQLQEDQRQTERAWADKSLQNLLERIPPPVDHQLPAEP